MLLWKYRNRQTSGSHGQIIRFFAYLLIIKKTDGIVKAERSQLLRSLPAAAIGHDRDLKVL